MTIFAESKKKRSQSCKVESYYLCLWELGDEKTDSWEQRLKEKRFCSISGHLNKGHNLFVVQGLPYLKASESSVCDPPGHEQSARLSADQLSQVKYSDFRQTISIRLAKY